MTIPVIADVDVGVVGGGAAGFTAAATGRDRRDIDLSALRERLRRDGAILDPVAPVAS